MGIENSLIGSYAIGTKEEIRDCVSQDGDLYPDYIGLICLAELGLVYLSRAVLPENVDHYVYISLFADLAVRFGSGLYPMRWDRNERQTRSLGLC